MVQPRKYCDRQQRHLLHGGGTSPTPPGAISEQVLSPLSIWHNLPLEIQKAQERTGVADEKSHKISPADALSFLGLPTSPLSLKHKWNWRMLCKFSSLHRTPLSRSISARGGWGKGGTPCPMDPELGPQFCLLVNNPRSIWSQTASGF